MDAIRKNLNKLSGPRLYFIRLDNNATSSRASKPYRTICSKIALNVGISDFTLWQDKGVCAYDTKEYNELSFQFGKNRENSNIHSVGRLVGSPHNKDYKKFLVNFPTLPSITSHDPDVRCNSKNIFLDIK